MEDKKPIRGLSGGVRKPKNPTPKAIEYSWDRKLMRLTERIVEAIKRGYMATKKYEEPWKATVKRILVFIESVVKVVAKVK